MWRRRMTSVSNITGGGSRVRVPDARARSGHPSDPPGPSQDRQRQEVGDNLINSPKIISGYTERSDRWWRRWRGRGAQNRRRVMVSHGEAPPTGGLLLQNQSRSAWTPPR